MIRQHRTTQGFTLIEVLVAATIIGLVAITQIPRLQGFLEERVRDEAISDVRKLSNSLRQFRATQNADPVSVNQLIGSDFYDGNQTLPWGATFSGTPIQIQDPNAPLDPTRQVSSGWVFSFQAQDIEQAALISEELSDLQAQVVGQAGTTVQWTVNASLLEVNQFQFIARTEEGQQLCPTCNEIEIDLDFRDSGSIDNVQDFDASQGQIRQASVGQVRLDASHAISIDNNNLMLDSSQTRFSGDVQVAQNLTATGQTRLQGGATIQGAASIDGDASISGNATVNGSATVNGNTTIGGNAVVNRRLTVANNATISGNVTGGFFSTTGDFSTQLTSLDLNRRDIDNNTDAITANASLIEANAEAIRGNAERIEMNLEGIGVNVEAIRGNDERIVTNFNGIERNTEAIVVNAERIMENEERIMENETRVMDNTSTIMANTSRITMNTTRVEGNTSMIGANADRIALNTSSIDEFRELWDQCVRSSGCRSTQRSDQ